MRRIVRDRRLTPEEAAKYRNIRKVFRREFAELPRGTTNVWRLSISSLNC